MTDPTTALIIRDALAEDIPRLLHLYLQLAEFSTIPETEVYPLTAAHQAALERITADPSVRLFVLEEGGRVIGSYALYVMPNLTHGGRPFAIVENVVVDATLRGGGHGRLLMGHAMAEARAADCYKIALTSNLKRGPAHAFYEALGYTHTHKGFTMYVDEGADR